MSTSVVARLRECIEYHALGLHPNYGPPSTLTHIECDTLSVLLDIVEAMAAVEPVDWNGERACLYCRVNIGDGDDHEPNCPKLLADELCGMEQDGAE